MCVPPLFATCRGENEEICIFIWTNLALHKARLGVLASLKVVKPHDDLVLNKPGNDVGLRAQEEEGIFSSEYINEVYSVHVHTNQG